MKRKKRKIFRDRQHNEDTLGLIRNKELQLASQHIRHIESENR